VIHFLQHRPVLELLAQNSVDSPWHNDCAQAVGEGGQVMKFLNNQRGAMGWALLWLLGIPIPILVILFLVRGCT
jgi:hypothetical protein